MGNFSFLNKNVPHFACNVAGKCGTPKISSPRIKKKSPPMHRGTFDF
jgi:hypothetical protein